MVSTITNSIKKVDHIVLTTKDIVQCLLFYKNLGFSTMAVNGRYELHAGDFKINVHILGHELHPHAHIAQAGTLDVCMEIDEDIHAYRNKLIDKGFYVSEIGYKYGVNGEMQSFYLRDPDQNLLEFCSYQA